MTDTVVQTRSHRETSTTQAEGVVEGWLSCLRDNMAAKDESAIALLFQEDAVARDLLALSWDFRNGVNRDEVASLLACTVNLPLAELAIRTGNVPLLAEEASGPSVEAFLTFRNEVGRGNGYVKLAQEDDGEWRASAFSLVLDELHNLPKLHRKNRPVGRSKSPQIGRKQWIEQFDAGFEKSEPSVVIIGAGHNGMMLAVRLQTMGISVLLIEKNEQVGDNWRNRYSSLALHTPLQSDSLPYLPFPETWTEFTPKDKLGDFLESYSKIMDLRVWTGSTAENMSYDEDSQSWSVDVVRADGSLRTLKPRHLVIAPGLLSKPSRPHFPGEELFKGTVIHTADYTGPTAWHGKKALVIGTGVSGHDIAQDLAEHGVDVTMVQRSETVVLSTSSFHQVMHSNHISGVYSIDDADLVNSATPFGELPRYGAAQLAQANRLDEELLTGLREAGFRLGSGPDGTGVLGLIFGKNSTGYYYNAGASELIIDGTITLEHGDMTGFTETGIILNDGEKLLDADLVICATGYLGPDAVVEQLLGADVARRLGSFFDVGEDREYGRLWRDSGIDHFWFMIALGIGDGRFYSNLLALQIAAEITGVTPEIEGR